MKSLRLAAATALVFSFVFSQKYGTGLQFDVSAYRKIPLTAPLMRGIFTELPLAASIVRYCPVAGSQGATSTCVGWATAYGARTILQAIDIESRDRLTSIAPFSPYFVYNQIKSSQGCDVATSIERALELLKDQGVPPLEPDKEDCDLAIADNKREIARKYRIDGYKRLFDWAAKEEKVTVIKKSLSENKPVILALNVSSSFYDARDIWNPGGETNEALGSHAVVGIAYNDDKYGGAFQILNSWGTDWGDSGRTWIKYGDIVRTCLAAYEMIKVPPKSMEPEMSGKSVFKLSSGELMPITQKDGELVVTKPYSSGTRFKVMLENRQSVYLYALASDARRMVTSIFPYDSTISPYMGYSKSAIALPGEDHDIVMDDYPGIDYFCLLYSKVPLSIFNLIERLSNTQAEFRKAVQAVFRNQVVDDLSIRYDLSEGISFAATLDDKSIVAVFVQIPHLQ